MDMIFVMLGLFIILVFAFRNERQIVEPPVSMWFTILAVVAPVLGAALFALFGIGTALWCGLAIAFHVVLLRVLFHAFERRLGRPPRSVVYQPRHPGDGPDRLYTMLFTVMGGVGYVMLGVLVKLAIA